MAVRSALNSRRRAFWVDATIAERPGYASHIGLACLQLLLLLVAVCPAVDVVEAAECNASPLVQDCNQRRASSLNFTRCRLTGRNAAQPQLLCPNVTIAGNTIVSSSLDLGMQTSQFTLPPGGTLQLSSLQLNNTALAAPTPAHPLRLLFFKLSPGAVISLKNVVIQTTNTAIAALVQLLVDEQSSELNDKFVTDAESYVYIVALQRANVQCTGVNVTVVDAASGGRVLRVITPRNGSELMTQLAASQARGEFTSVLLQTNVSIAANDVPPGGVIISQDVSFLGAPGDYPTGLSLGMLVNIFVMINISVVVHLSDLVLENLAMGDLESARTAPGKLMWETRPLWAFKYPRNESQQVIGQHLTLVVPQLEVEYIEYWSILYNSASPQLQASAAWLRPNYWAIEVASIGDTWVFLDRLETSGSNVTDFNMTSIPVIFPALPLPPAAVSLPPLAPSSIPPRLIIVESPDELPEAVHTSQTVYNDRAYVIVLDWDLSAWNNDSQPVTWPEGVPTIATQVTLTGQSAELAPLELGFATSAQQITNDGRLTLQHVCMLLQPAAADVDGGYDQIVALPELQPWANFTLPMWLFSFNRSRLLLRLQDVELLVPQYELNHITAALKGIQDVFLQPQLPPGERVQDADPALDSPSSTASSVSINGLSVLELSGIVMQTDGSVLVNVVQGLGIVGTYVVLRAAPANISHARVRSLPMFMSGRPSPLGSRSGDGSLTTATKIAVATASSVIIAMLLAFGFVAYQRRRAAHRAMGAAAVFKAKAKEEGARLGTLSSLRDKKRPCSTSKLVTIPSDNGSNGSSGGLSIATGGSLAPHTPTVGASTNSGSSSGTDATLLSSQDSKSPADGETGSAPDLGVKVSMAAAEPVVPARRAARSPAALSPTSAGDGEAGVRALKSSRGTTATLVSGAGTAGTRSERLAAATAALQDPRRRFLAQMDAQLTSQMTEAAARRRVLVRQGGGGAVVASAVSVGGVAGGLSTNGLDVLMAAGSSSGGGVNGPMNASTQEVHLLEPIAVGSYGRVYRALWRGSSVAVKSLVLPSSMSGADRRHKMAITETAISTCLSHPNCVQTFTYLVQPVYATNCNVLHSAGSATIQDTACADGSSNGAAASFLHNSISSPALDAAAVTTGTHGISAWEVWLVLELCDRGSLRSALTSGRFHGRVHWKSQLQVGNSADGATIPAADAVKESRAHSGLLVSASSGSLTHAIDATNAAAAAAPAPGTASASSAVPAMPRACGGSGTDVARTSPGAAVSQISITLQQPTSSTVAAPHRRPWLSPFSAAPPPPISEAESSPPCSILDIPSSCPVDYAAVLCTALDVARAMVHLHSENILHGDLKASNVLLKSGNGDGRGDSREFTAKVSDFGLSCKLDPGATSVTFENGQGTPTHLAPEALLQGTYSRASDVFAFGILLFELYTASIAYEAVPAALLGHEISVAGLRPTFPPDCPPGYQSIACKCWAPEPSHRPSFIEVHRHLQQLWQEHLRSAHPIAKSSSSLVALTCSSRAPVKAGVGWRLFSSRRKSGSGTGGQAVFHSAIGSVEDQGSVMRGDGLPSRKSEYADAGSDAHACSTLGSFFYGSSAGLGSVS